MNAHDLEGLALVVVFCGMAGTLVALGGRALWRRGRESRGADLQQIDEQSANTLELEAQSRRVAELEERLDFAERLLAQRRDAAPLPVHRTPV